MKTITDASPLAGNKISTQTGIGTAVAIAGVAAYSLIKAKLEEEKRVSLLHFITCHTSILPNPRAVR